VAEARPFRDLDAGEAVELGELLAFISDWLATNHQLSLDARIAGDIAFGEVLVLPRSSAKTRELRYFGGLDAVTAPPRNPWIRGNFLGAGRV
jgi:hypothetical protein